MEFVLFGLVALSVWMTVLVEATSVGSEEVITDFWNLDSRSILSRAGALEEGRSRFHSAVDALQFPDSCDDVHFCHCQYAVGPAGLFAKLHSRSLCLLQSVLRNCTLIDMSNDKLSPGDSYLTSECTSSNATSVWECYFQPLTHCPYVVGVSKSKRLSINGHNSGCSFIEDKAAKLEEAGRSVVGVRIPIRLK